MDWTGTKPFATQNGNDSPCHYYDGNIGMARAVVVPQLVEWQFSTPEIRDSNPDIGKILFTNCTMEKTNIKKKGPFKIPPEHWNNRASIVNCEHNLFLANDSNFSQMLSLLIIKFCNSISFGVLAFCKLLYFYIDHLFDIILLPKNAPAY